MGECFFWYRPTRVVPDKRPLNGCCCCCVVLQICLVQLEITLDRWRQSHSAVLNVPNSPRRSHISLISQSHLATDLETFEKARNLKVVKEKSEKMFLPMTYYHEWYDRHKMNINEVFKKVEKVSDRFLDYLEKSMYHTLAKESLKDSLCPLTSVTSFDEEDYACRRNLCEIQGKHWILP